MARDRVKKNGPMKWALSLVIIAVVAVGGYWLGGGLNASSADATDGMGNMATSANQQVQMQTGNYASVTRGNLSATVYGEGKLAPASKKIIFNEVEGKVTSVDVEEGDTVQAGDVLMRLSSDDLESEVSGFQAELFSKQVELAAVRDKGSDTYIYAPCAGRLKLIDVEVDDDIAVTMKTKGKLAVISRDDKLKIEFESSQSTGSLKVGDAVNAWIDNKSVAGVVDQLSGLGGRIAVTVEDDEYDIGQEVLVSTLLGERLGTGTLEINMPVPVTGIGGTISKIYFEEEDSVTSGAKVFYLDGRIPSAELQQALLNYNNARTDLDNAFEKQESLVVRAPISGVITAVNASEGQQLEKSTAAFGIQSSGQFKLTADVDELDIVNVREGQQVTVDLDAYPGQSFLGMVSKVSGIAKVSGGVATYEVTVNMDASEYLKDGMTASMNVLVGDKSGVLMVPTDAIQTTNGQSFVTTSDGRQMFVTTGISSNDYIEIVAGVNEGEMVQLRERSEQNMLGGFPMAGGGGNRMGG